MSNVSGTRSTMTDAEGTLCAICESIFKPSLGLKHRTIFGDLIPNMKIAHHQRYCDLKASKDAGCFICSWIWSRHQVHRTRRNNHVGAREWFAITCTRHLRLCPRRAIFHVTCSWATAYNISGTYYPTYLFISLNFKLIIFKNKYSRT